MTTSKLWILLSTILAISISACNAAAQTSPAKSNANAQATAALRAIDACEANLEADLSHAGKDDFQEVIKNSSYKTKLLQAHNAVDKVSDPDLHRDLNILLMDVEYGVSNAGIGAIIDRKDTGLKKAEDQYRSDRDLVATEITTGKPGLLRDAVLKRSQKK